MKLSETRCGLGWCVMQLVRSPQTACCTARQAGRRWTDAGLARSTLVWDAHAPTSAPRGWTSETSGLMEGRHTHEIKSLKALRVWGLVWNVISEHTSLRHDANVLLEFLSLRWGAARSGELSVNIIRDGLKRCSETRGRGKHTEMTSGRKLRERD